jgi:protein-disulfide isomerase
MKDEKKKSNSGIPLIIIVLVFAGVVGGAYYLYRSAKDQKPANNSNGVTNTNSGRTPSTVAPIGANPPNMLGSPTAAVTVEEFADFQCGSCAATHPVMKEVQSIYGSKIKFVFRNFPLQMHDKAYDAAVVAEAAGIQGKFWQMQDQLFTNQTTWASPSANHKALWNEYAQKIGLDVQQFQNDVAGMAAKSRVDQDMGRGRALNVGSTPTILINGQSVPYPEVNVAGLRRIIDEELQKAAATQTRPQAPPANATGTSNNSNVANK